MGLAINFAKLSLSSRANFIKFNRSYNFRVFYKETMQHVLNIHISVVFQDYGCQFKAGDVVGAYLDLDAEPAVMSFTVNGDHQGIAYEIRKSEIGDQPLFPHILTKNVRYTVSNGFMTAALADIVISIGYYCFQR